VVLVVVVTWLVVAVLEAIAQAQVQVEVEHLLNLALFWIVTLYIQ
jgi:hypothetical protein